MSLGHEIMYDTTPPHAATQTHTEKYHWLTLPTEAAAVPTIKVQRTMQNLFFHTQLCSITKLQGSVQSPDTNIKTSSF
jgi:hypothetical protein